MSVSSADLKLLSEHGFNYPWSPQEALKLVEEIVRLRKRINTLVNSK